MNMVGGVLLAPDWAARDGVRGRWANCCRRVNGAPERGGAQWDLVAWGTKRRRSLRLIDRWLRACSAPRPRPIPLVQRGLLGPDGSTLWLSAEAHSPASRRSRDHIARPQPTNGASMPLNMPPRTRWRRTRDDTQIAADLARAVNLQVRNCSAGPP